MLGDLAEVAVYQGPRLQGDLYIGPAGNWNDTEIPRVRYMDQRNQGLWQMTDAEALGDIDGTHCWYIRELRSPGFNIYFLCGTISIFLFYILGMQDDRFLT